MFAVSKNHKSRQLEVNRANVYFILHERDTKYEKWAPSGDKLTKEEKAAHFGVVEGPYMIVHTILDISDDETDLWDRIKSNDRKDKIKNLKRFSVDNDKILMSELSAYDSNVLDAKNNTKTQLRKEKLKGAHSNAEKLDSRKRSSTDISSSLAAKSLKSDSPGTSEKLDDGQNKTTVDTNFTADDLCEGNCAMTKFYQTELVAAQKVIKEQQAEIKELHDKNRKAVEKFSDKLLQLKDTTKKSRSWHEVSETTSDHNKTFLENLNGWKGACLLGDEEIPDGKIHFGDGIFLEAKVISAEVESKELDIRKRINLLVQKLFPDDYLRRTIEPNVAKFPDPLLVSQTNITIMTMALEKMFWDQPVDLSRSNVSGKLRRILGTLRDQAKSKLLSPEEQARLRREKAEKVKARRKEKRALEKQSKENKKQTSKGSKEQDDSNGPESSDEDQSLDS